MSNAISNSQHMTCMEVWGGNQTAESSVVMAGLDAWVYSQPYQGAASGGDVYYVSNCATGRITRLLLADVSGHGEQVAQIGAGLRMLMRRYVNHISQSSFVSKMNSQFSGLAESGGFATAAVATFFAPTNDLSFSNAGHPAPLLYRAKSRQWLPLESATKRSSPKDDGMSDMPLGLVDESSYAEHRLRLRVSDLVLFYTDSLIESLAADGEQIGTDGLLKIIRRLDATRPETLTAALLAAIAAQHENNLTEDDVTVLLFRPNGQSPSVPLRNRLTAPLRVLAGIIRSLFHGGQGMPLPEFSVTNLGGAMFDSLSQLGARDPSPDESFEG